MSSATTGHVEPVSIEAEIRESYMAYAMSVIVGRALPDVRDGLKPVHRRILYAMHEMGNTYNKAHKKSARVVGDVIGKYHPHGDSAVYDALVRLAQDFNMRLPLVDGQGNFGSIDGDPPAAMRYTEVRMARACGELLADIDKDTVDFEPNYDGSEHEPLVMPTRIPNLLINGSNGIAVGMATNIPPHNLNEVLDATIALMKDPSLSVIDLMQYIEAPDFPTAGIIYGRKGILDAYTTGRGVLKIRAKTRIEEMEKGRNRHAIIVEELPYQVNKARLLEKIAQLVRDKKIEGISDLRDESDRRGMRIVIELRATDRDKREVQPEIVLNQLFKMTALQSSFGVIMLAIVAGQPQVLTLREVLEHFIEFRRDVVMRRSIYELRKARERAHILEGLEIALDNLDEAIELIRASPNGQAARASLMTRFSLSEPQAQAILDMRLQKLTALERDKILDELKALRKEIQRIEAILGSRVLLDEVITKEFEELREAFPSPRRTAIVEDTGEIGVEDLIAEEDMIVTLSQQNYIKRMPLTEYRVQNRGGRGKTGMTTKDDDFVEDLFVTSSHSSIFVFTNHGRVFHLKVYELPTGNRTFRGRPIINLLPRLNDGEGIASVMPVPTLTEPLFVLTATRRGIVKKTSLDAFKNINVAGLIAVNLRDGDELIKVRLVAAGQDILLATKKGMAIRFGADDVRSTGRATSGVVGIRLREDDELISMDVVRDESATLLTITTLGYGKRTPMSEYRVQNRGGLGLITIKCNERNGNVVGIWQVNPGEQIMIATNNGTMMRTAINDISEYGRNTQGVRVIRLTNDEHVVAVARVVDEDDAEDANADGANVEGANVEGANAEGVNAEGANAAETESE